MGYRRWGLVVLSLGLVGCGQKTPVKLSASLQSPVVPLNPGRASDKALQTVADGANQFAAGLYQQLPGDGNRCFSPWNAVLTLGMLRTDLDETPARELLNSLGWRGKPDAYDAAVGNLTRRMVIGHEGGFQLHLANRGWYLGVEPTGEERLRLRNRYGADLELYPSRVGDAGLSRRVNEWVSDQTRHMIPGLLSPEDARSVDHRLLVSAIALEAQWDNPFELQATRQEPFYPLVGPTVTVPLMGMETELPYARLGDCHVAQLPYRDGPFGMVIILPDQGQLAAAEARLGEILGGLSDLESRDVELRLPRWTFDQDLDLAPLLQGLGALPTRTMARQRTYLKVDEEGTVAMAAMYDGMAMGMATMPVGPVRMRCDHPFLFALRHLATGAILFLGRVADPSV